MENNYILGKYNNNIIIEQTNLEERNIPSDHYHNFYELYFYLGDDMTYFIESNSYHIKKYDIVFIDKNNYHRSNYNNDDRERILIMFHEDLFDIISDMMPVLSTLQLLADTRVISFSMSTKKEIYNSILKIVKYYQTNKEDLFAVKIMLLNFLLSIRNYINEGLLRPGVVAADRSNLFICEITNYINNNYSEKIALDALAHKFFVDKYYLCRIFKKITGMTVVEFTNNKRLMEAKRMLESSDISIFKISSLVGFQNQNHFNFLFKRMYGYPPSQYKNAARMSANN